MEVDIVVREVKVDRLVEVILTGDGILIAEELGVGVEDTMQMAETLIINLEAEGEDMVILVVMQLVAELVAEEVMVKVDMVEEEVDKVDGEILELLLYNIMHILYDKCFYNRALRIKHRKTLIPILKI